MAAELRRRYDAWVTDAVTLAKSTLGASLRSVVVFGSVARQTPHAGSDIDLLLIVRPLPKGRGPRADLAASITGVWDARGDDRPELSLVLRTPDEVRDGFALLLDIIHEGKVVFDPEDEAHVLLAEWRAALQRQGARRVQTGDTWHWDLGRPEEEVRTR